MTSLPIPPIADNLIAIPPSFLVAPEPVTPFRVAQKQLDVASQTVLGYFKAIRNADTGAQADHFDHLVAICFRAVQPYFLRQREGVLVVARVPQYSDKDGKRTASSTRREGTPDDATRTWIQGWLLEFLVPYQGKSEVELIAAANAGKFRKLGFWCRLRLKNIVYRQQKREAKEELAGFVTADENLGVRGLGAASSLSRVSFEDVLAGAANASRIVEANAVELDRLALLVGLRA